MAKSVERLIARWLHSSAVVSHRSEAMETVESVGDRVAAREATGAALKR